MKVVRLKKAQDTPAGSSDGRQAKDQGKQGGRVCVKCGYSLAGLPDGTRCPECGTASRTAARRGKKTVLGEAPPKYLNLLGLGLILTGLGGVAMIIGVAFGAGDSPLGLIVIPAVISVAIGAVIVSARKQHGGAHAQYFNANDTGGGVRKAVRVCFGAVLVGGIVSAIPGLPGWIATPMSVLALLGLYGYLPLGVYLSDIADWAGDDGISGHLRGATSLGGLAGAVLAFSALVFELMNTGLGAFFGIVAVFALFVIAGSIGFFSLICMQMVTMVSWAARNHETALERDMRLEEKRQQHEKEMAERAQARIDAMPAPAPIPSPSEPAASTEPQQGSTGQSSETEKKDLNPYGLADD